MAAKFCVDIKILLQVIIQRSGPGVESEFTSKSDPCNYKSTASATGCDPANWLVQLEREKRETKTNGH